MRLILTPTKYMPFISSLSVFKRPARVLWEIRVADVFTQSGRTLDPGAYTVDINSGKEAPRGRCKLTQGSWPRSSEKGGDNFSAIKSSIFLIPSNVIVFQLHCQTIYCQLLPIRLFHRHFSRNEMTEMEKDSYNNFVLVSEWLWKKKVLFLICPVQPIAEYLIIFVFIVIVKQPSQLPIMHSL